MTSTVFPSSFHSSATGLSPTTHFPIPVLSDSPAEVSPSVHYNHFYFKSRVINRSKRRTTQVKSAAANTPTSAPPSTLGGAGDDQPRRNLRILVAGGGIGGLVFALAAKKKGFEVVVFEKDVCAIRGEGQYRGPIQIQNNALAALEAIDLGVAEEIMRVGCVTGDRINGLVDGLSGTWYVKFDTFTPAVERGLPVTRVISRIILQQILARAVGGEVILNDSNVVNFEDDGDKVTVMLENGQCYEGDLLVGADGIWSKVRTSLFGQKEATYSGYTCYTGLADFVPADIESVGYRVFLGHKQYFVSSDVGAGKMQWYAFHNEPTGGVDAPNGKKEKLLQIFGGWCDNVIDLILATDEVEILRRDIYDRTPIFTWGRGHVTLLGDSVHAMQPNMGQGGCLAIEDSYQLALELDKAWRQSIEVGTPVDVVSSLKSHERARRIRVAVIHGMARAAALMASTYKAYLGIGLGPFEFLTKLRIPHPGRVGGRVLVDLAMPLMLNWVLGGISSELEGRPVCCRLSDKANNQLQRWFQDDDALERALSGEWFLFPVGGENGDLKPICLNKDANKPYVFGHVFDSGSCLVICYCRSVSHANFPETSVVIPSPQVSKMHASIGCTNGAFFVTDFQSKHGTWITDNEGRQYRLAPNFPSRFHPSDVIEFGSDKKVAFRAKVMKAAPNIGENKEGDEIVQAV